MKRKLFCEISPLTYRLSTWRCILQRRLNDLVHCRRTAKEISPSPLPVKICRHNSLIRRQLGNVDMTLQENKAVNLALACKKVSGIIIRPGETFSFWHLVGSPSPKKGYLNGLTIKNGHPSSGIGGGMCQFTNLIHWMVLHSDLTITEHHHHDGLDIFPDFNRQIPFGTGTSILYNYLDYRFKNETDHTYQLITYLSDRYLCGELLSDKPQQFSYHICSEDEFFSREGDSVFRNSKVYRLKVDKASGRRLEKKLIRQNHARVMYDTANLEIRNK